jgi:hypothetical protein
MFFDHFFMGELLQPNTTTSGVEMIEVFMLKSWKGVSTA